jgi:hypothetical protein
VGPYPCWRGRPAPGRKTGPRFPAKNVRQRGLGDAFELAEVLNRSAPGVTATSRSACSAARRGERGRQLRWPAGHRRPCSLARPAAGPAGASAGAGAPLRRRGSRLWHSAGWSSSCSASQPSSSWRAVVIASDRVGAITSLSPAHGMGGTAACLGSNDIWVPRVAWKDLTPGRAPADLRSLDADALHRSPPRPLAREAFNAGKPAFKRLSRDRRLTAPRAIGARVRGVGQLGKWSDRAPAPAGPGGSTVARRPASACWCPSGATRIHRISERSRPPC